MRFWSLDIFNDVTKTHELGFFVAGAETDSMPTTDSVTYSGKMNGFQIHQGGTGENYLTGKSELTANFATQKMTGEINTLVTANSQTNIAKNLIYNILLSDGKIEASGFTGKLKLSEEINLNSSSISGKFYGDSVQAVGATGQSDSGVYITTFGLLATKPED